MFVGYARISTQEQTLGLQHDALHRAGCECIFTDTASGANARPGDALGILDSGMHRADPAGSWAVRRDCGADLLQPKSPPPVPPD